MASVVAGGLAMAQSLLPRYAEAQTISFTDTRIKAQYVTYSSPGGSSGQMRGYLVQPPGPGPFYPGTQHGFHNNSMPRYQEAAAKLAWERTVGFFKTNLA